MFRFRDMTSLAHGHGVDPLGGAASEEETASGPAQVWEAARRDRSNYRWLTAYSATLVAARSEFDGDLDRLLVYLVFMMSEMSRRIDGGAAKGVNALSVADITLIPRETVRRKLRELANLGHLRQGEDGLWYLDDGLHMERLTMRLRKLFPTGTDLRPAA